MAEQTNNKLPAVQAGICPSCDSMEFRTCEVPARGVVLKICTHCGLYINADPVTAQEATDQGAYDERFHGFYRRRAARKVRHSKFRLMLMESLVSPGRFLDIGCSMGYFVEAAAQRGWDAHGVDISPDAVALCRQRGLQVKVGDMQRLDYPDNTIDLINLQSVLEHDVDLYECLREIGRVLSPAGLLLIQVPCVDYHRVRLQGTNYHRFWHPVHCYWFSHRAARNVMRRAGYREVRLPRYGNQLSTVGMAMAVEFVGWRTHRMLKSWLRTADYHASAWQKHENGPPAAR